MASRYERDRAWADKHEAEIQEILRRVLSPRVDVQPAPRERDLTEAIDYEVELRKNTVACRVRQIKSCGKLRDLTVRTSAPRGYRSEAVKLGGGGVDWYLYAWGDGTTFVDWMVVDMSRVVAEGLMDRAMEQGAEVRAYDGRFLYISADELESRRAIAAASWLG